METSSKGNVPGLHLCRQLFVLNLLLHFVRHPELVLGDVPENQTRISLSHRVHRVIPKFLKEPSVVSFFYLMLLYSGYIKL